jgi:hypothetical protein
MIRAKLLLMRFLVLVFAIAAPAGVIVLMVGQPPAAYDLTTLENWAPFKAAGPSSRALADGVTRLAGPKRNAPPDWFNAEDQDLLSKARAAWEANKLQEGLGHLMVLSSRMDDQGKTLKDFLPMVAPDIATWLVSTYFAPALMGTLLVMLASIVFLPWLARRLLDVVKVMIGLGLAIAAAVAAVALCLSLPSQSALVYTLVEYLTAVVILTIIGNTILLFRRWRKPPPVAVAPVAVTVPVAALEPPLRRERPSVLQSSYQPPGRNRLVERPAPASAPAEAAPTLEADPAAPAPGHAEPDAAPRPGPQGAPPTIHT